MAGEHDVRATARFVLASAQKVRLVVDQVRGRPAKEALDMLRFSRKSAAEPVRKVIRSAMANAEQNYGLDPDALFVARIWADEGPTRRWRRFGARGRFKPILRRAAHITVILRERPGAAG
ncbi:MAG TPA: 50S ribosomal protein L22 [Anaerolineales bacterium]|nr:50S ribosomal protein L22 [Anaerolineales bacterium]